MEPKQVTGTINYLIKEGKMGNNNNNNNNSYNNNKNNNNNNNNGNLQWHLHRVAIRPLGMENFTLFVK